MSSIDNKQLVLWGGKWPDENNVLEDWFGSVKVIGGVRKWFWKNNRIGLQQTRTEVKRAPILQEAGHNFLPAGNLFQELAHGQRCSLLHLHQLRLETTIRDYCQLNEGLNWKLEEGIHKNLLYTYVEVRASFCSLQKVIKCVYKCYFIFIL